MFLKCKNASQFQNLKHFLTYYWTALENHFNNYANKRTKKSEWSEFPIALIKEDEFYFNAFCNGNGVLSYSNIIIEDLIDNASTGLAIALSKIKKSNHSKRRKNETINHWLCRLGHAKGQNLLDELLELFDSNVKGITV